MRFKQTAGFMDQLRLKSTDKKDFLQPLDLPLTVIKPYLFLPALDK
jgi:hypothetical protein